MENEAIIADFNVDFVKWYFWFKIDYSLMIYNEECL